MMRLSFNWSAQPPRPPAALLALALAVTACNSIPGTEQADTSYRHGFSLKNQNGEFIGPEGLEFAAEPDDFADLWSFWLEDNPAGGRVGAYRLSPQLTALDGESLDLSPDRSLCLTGPITLYRVGELEPLAEIPAGTCLDNGGSTTLTLDP